MRGEWRVDEWCVVSGGAGGAGHLPGQRVVHVDAEDRPLFAVVEQRHRPQRHRQHRVRAAVAREHRDRLGRAAARRRERALPARGERGERGGRERAVDVHHDRRRAVRRAGADKVGDAVGVPRRRVAAAAAVEKCAARGPRERDRVELALRPPEREARRARRRRRRLVEGRRGPLRRTARLAARAVGDRRALPRLPQQPELAVDLFFGELLRHVARGEGGVGVLIARPAVGQLGGAQLSEAPPLAAEVARHPRRPRALRRRRERRRGVGPRGRRRRRCGRRRRRAARRAEHVGRPRRGDDVAGKPLRLGHLRRCHRFALPVARLAVDEALERAVGAPLPALEARVLRLAERGSRQIRIGRRRRLAARRAEHVRRAGGGDDVVGKSLRLRHLRRRHRRAILEARLAVDEAVELIAIPLPVLEARVVRAHGCL